MTKKTGDSYGVKRNRKTVRVKTARGRKPSSTEWLKRQLNDPYVARAKEEGYRSRAAYKLLEIQDKYKIYTKGDTVVDLGCAPGSWLQVIAAQIGAHEKSAIIGIDLQEITPPSGTDFIHGDFTEEEPYQRLLELCGGKTHCVLSDMAAASTGHTQTDHIRIMHLCELALDFAVNTLAPGGNFCAKVLRGGTEGELLKQLKQHFTSVKHIKPQASRQDSAEMYVVALGFRG